MRLKLRRTRQLPRQRQTSKGWKQNYQMTLKLQGGENSTQTQFKFQLVESKVQCPMSRAKRDYELKKAQYDTEVISIVCVALFSEVVFSCVGEISWLLLLLSCFYVPEL